MPSIPHCSPYIHFEVMGLRRELGCSIQGLNIKPEMKSKRLFHHAGRRIKGQGVMEKVL